MNSHSNEIKRSQIAYRLEMAEKSAYWSEHNECDVVVRKCADCEAWFEEEKEAAKTKIRRAEPDLCLMCDPAASAPSFKNVNVFGMWIGF